MRESYTVENMERSKRKKGGRCAGISPPPLVTNTAMCAIAKAN
jgi:hypothetical protein